MTETQRTELTPQEQQIIELEQADRNLELVRRGWRGSHRTAEELTAARSKRDKAILEVIRSTHIGEHLDVAISLEKSYSRVRVVIPPVSGTTRHYPLHVIADVNQLVQIDPNVREILIQKEA